MSRSFDALVQASAGAGGGVFSTSILFPLDSVKTRIQTHTTASSNVVGAAREIIEAEGVSALFRGLGIKCIEAGTKNFAYFYCYDFLINTVKQSGTKITPSITLVLGYIAGVVNMTPTMPLEVLGIRQQTSSSSTDTFSFAQKIWREEGLAGFYKGFTFNLLLCINPAIQNTVFDYLKLAYQRMIRLRHNMDPKRKVKLTPIQAFALGAFAKLLATLITYPWIARKARLQSGTEEQTGLGFFQKHFRGLSSASLKTVLQAALMYMAKDQIALQTQLLFQKAKLFRANERHKLRAVAGRAIC
eukprot:GEMP01040453.1.p1 GENE.GEMP01040453.1~~GEMP01040453.1.p1  ORF type:complete len:301 (+),score=47.36 GEMP01040453.1:216-1118(+)